MGQKVSPHGLRLGIIKDWDSRWYAGKEKFSEYLIEDYKIREFLKKKLYTSGVAKIEIERSASDLSAVKVYVHCAKPGIVIGRGGAEIEKIKALLEKKVKKSIAINIVEVKQQDIVAQLIAENVAFQLERRISFRRAMKQAIRRAIMAHVKGIKIQVSGRLAGAEIARSERYSEGNIPLQTLRADIDYGFAQAHTTYGIIGVKVWVCNGEVLKGDSGENFRKIEEKRNVEEKRFTRNFKRDFKSESKGERR